MKKQEVYKKYAARAVGAHRDKRYRIETVLCALESNFLWENLKDWLRPVPINRKHVKQSYKQARKYNRKMAAFIGAVLVDLGEWTHERVTSQRETVL